MKLLPKDYKPEPKHSLTGPFGNGVDIDIKAMEANQQPGFQTDPVDQIVKRGNHRAILGDQDARSVRVRDGRRLNRSGESRRKAKILDDGL